MNEKIIKRYLRIKSKRRGFIRGTLICKHLGIPLRQAIQLESIADGSFGPVRMKSPVTLQAQYSYARDNAFMVDNPAYYIIDGHFRHTTHRPLRKGKQLPRYKYPQYRSNDE